jgi:hypothetical protein
MDRGVIEEEEFEFSDDEWDTAEFGGLWDGGEYTIEDMPGCTIDDEFDLSVVVKNHIWLKFDPVRPPAADACQSYTFDSQMIFDSVAQTWASVGVLQAYDTVIGKAKDPANVTAAFTSGYFIGRISATDVLDAMDAFDGAYTADYDVILDSCAAKILDMMFFLGLQDVATNSTFQAWMSKHLKTPFVMELVRNSTNIVQLYPQMPLAEILAKNNTELIERLVGWSVDREIGRYAEVLAYLRATEPKPPSSGASTPMLPLMTIGLSLLVALCSAIRAIHA